MPPGYSCTPTLPTGDGERGKRPGGARRPLGVGAGAPSAVAAGAWRSRRSTPRPGKPATWGKGGSERAARSDGRRSPVNTSAPLPSLEEAQERVLHVQRKLHEWASEDAERRFQDLWNLVCDPATLVVAWSRVSQNRGSRTAGIDGKTRSYVEQQLGVARLLEELRDELKTGRFRALPVRERMIPKRDGRMRRLGIPTLRDRVVQMALKLVIEPIFESGLYASSYGYRPGRRRRTRSPRSSTSRRSTPTMSGSSRRTSRRAWCHRHTAIAFMGVVSKRRFRLLGPGFAGLVGVRCGRGARRARRA